MAEARALKLCTKGDYEDMKGDEKCNNWGGLGVRGYPRSSETSSFDRAHSTSYSTLIETMRVSCTIFELEHVCV